MDLMLQLDNNSIDFAMTSPPYWGLRDYGVEGQLGLESHPNEYIKKIVQGFNILKKKLKKTGSFYLNMGDTYFGSGQGHKEEHFWNEDGTPKNKFAYKRESIGAGIPKEKKWLKLRTNWLQPKQLMLMPSRLAIAIQEDGWILRNDIIWHKPNPMPSSVKDRLNTTFEHLFHFVKNKKYYYDLDNIREAHKEVSLNRNKYGVSAYSCDQASRNRSLDPGEFLNPKGKNPRDFLTIPTQPFPQAHFAVYPVALCEKPIKSSVPNEICVECGLPRTRIVEKGDMINPHGMRNIQENEREIHDEGWNREKGYAPNCYRESKTVGYIKCNCNKGFKGAVVLDPFCGTGTTWVALKKYKPNAKFIGFELKKEYIDMAYLRVGKRSETGPLLQYQKCQN